MEIKQEQHGEIAVFYISGRLDGLTSPSVNEQILASIESDSKYILIDCKQLEYISSSGIRILLQAYSKASDHGSSICLSSLSHTVEQTLYITGFLSYFKVYNDTKTAISDISSK